MNVFVVVVKDRHIGIDVRVFSKGSRAFDYAREQAAANASDPDDIDEQDLTEGMVKEGWVFFCVYSIEDDIVYVQKRKVDEEP